MQINSLIENYSTITFHGKHEAYIQNYCSLYDVTTNYIKVRGKAEIIVIEGIHLFIKFMSSDELLICGEIEKLSIMEAHV